MALTLALAATFSFVALALSAFLLTTRGRTLQLRLLALWLALEGLSALLFAAHLAFQDARPLAEGVVVTLALRLVVAPFALLAFLGTIETPLARPYATPLARRFLFVVALLLGTLVIAFRAEVWRVIPVRAGWTVVWLPSVIALNILGGAVTIYGSAVAIDALRRSPRHSLERSRAWMLLVGTVLTVGAIGLQQALMVGLELSDPSLHQGYMRGPIGVVMLDEGRNIAGVLGCAVLVYGILRVQLFDADLRLKWTISHGTVAAIYIGVFFIISQLAQGFLSETFGWAMGGIAAALLLLAIHPLQRMAERVANTAMPNVRDTPEWRDQRKKEIYRTAVRLALTDHAITRDEELHLADLATQLGLDPRRALDLRRAVESESQ